MGHLARNAKTLRLISDLLSFIIVFYICYYLSRVFNGHTLFVANSSIYFETLILCVLSWSIALALVTEYPVKRERATMRELENVLVSNVLAVLLFTLNTFLFKVQNISRSFVGLYLALVVICMLLNRYAVRMLLIFLRSSVWDTQTRILVGSGPIARRYLATASSDRTLGVRIIGYIGEAGELGTVPYLGRYEDIDYILKHQTPDSVVVALRVTDPHMEQIINACEKQGISVELLLDSLAFQIASSTVHHGPMVSSLCLSAIPHTPGPLLVKRATDIIISLTACLLLSPLFLLVAISIKLEDGGPVFFKQQRVGLRNQLFWMYKFRSMRVDAEEMKSSLAHLNEMSGPVFKLTHDPRITKVGKFIRSFSIDELPQLFNVLMGSMSLVGPRPPLPSEVSLYADEYRRRLSVKPGLTCLWQVSGRNDVDFDQWMNLDLAYIDNWSYLQDWKILFLTIPAVLKRTGAR